MTQGTRPGELSRAVARPHPVTVALGGLVLLVIGNVAGPLLPSSEGDIAFGVVSALIAIVAAWGLWAMRRWGRVMTIVVAALNFVSDAPAVVAGSTALIKVVAGLTVFVCVLIIGCLTRPDARRTCRSEE